MASLRKALLAAPAAAVLGGLCDLAIGRNALNKLAGGGDWFWFGAHLLTVHLLLAFGLAAVLGSILSTWDRVERPTGTTRHDVAAAAVAAGVVMALAAAVGAAGSGFIRGMANPLLAAVATGLLVAIGAAVAALSVGPAAWLVARRLLAGRNAPLATVGLTLLAVMGCATAWLGPRIEWGALPLGLVLVPLFSVAVLGVAARRPPPKGVAVLAAFVAVVGVGQALPGFPGTSAAGEALLNGPPLAARAVQIGRALLDADGDGYSARLGGGDCDDSNPEIGPGAIEIPGNGIDDDCLDGDAPVPAPSAAPTPSAVDAGSPSLGSMDGGAATDAVAPKPAADRPNILFILVDTLRADHIGAWGYSRPTTPHIDALAAQSVRFSRNYAQSPHTPRSIPSLFTSRLPSRIDFDGPRRSYPRLKDSAVTLAESLKAAGYRTEGVFSHFYWSEKRNILQGFDATDNSGAKDIKGSNRDIAAPRVFARYKARLAELQKQSSPWFLFVHYFEPHSTYLRHKPPHDFGKGWMDKYDGEIHFVDAWVGKTLAVLAGSPAKDRTVVVLTSDHGEGNGEHGFKWHGQHLYDEVLHVPLLIRGPGIVPRTVDVPVALMDIAPTLVELAGGPTPPEFEGRSLAAALRGEPLAVSPVRAELVPYPGWKEHIQAVVDFPLKLIRNRTKNTWELFDLSVDPREQSNLYRKRTEDAKRLRGLLVTPAAAGPG